MAEVELTCAVYGEGTVFSVKVNPDAKVEALQKAIFHDQRCHERFSFPSSALTLYLAKKNGAWLKDDDSVDGLLVGKIDTSYQKMRSSWILDEDYLGADFKPARKEIHVLVELPKTTSATVATGRDERKSVLEQLGSVTSQLNEELGGVKSQLNEELGGVKSQLNMVLENQQKRCRERVAMSQMSSAKRQKLLGMLKLPVEVLNLREPKVKQKDKIPVFDWDPNLDEDKQVAGDKGYKKYLADHFSRMLTVRGLCFQYVEGKKDLLDGVDERLPFDLTGGADVLVLKDIGEFTAENVRHLNGLHLVIELTKDIGKGLNEKEAQSIAELIAANLRAPDESAVALLTDLRYKWIFMWLSEDRKIAKVTVKEPTNAAVINAIVSSDDLSVCIPFPGAPSLLRRGNIDSFRRRRRPRGDGGKISSDQQRVRPRYEYGPRDWMASGQADACVC